MHPNWWLVPGLLFPITVIGWSLWSVVHQPNGVVDLGPVLELAFSPAAWMLVFLSYLTVTSAFICLAVDRGWTSAPSRCEYQQRRRSTRAAAAGDETTG